MTDYLITKQFLLDNVCRASFKFEPCQASWIFIWCTCITYPDSTPVSSNFCSQKRRLEKNNTWTCISDYGICIWRYATIKQDCIQIWFHQRLTLHCNELFWMSIVQCIPSGDFNWQHLWYCISDHISSLNLMGGFIPKC